MNFRFLRLFFVVCALSTQINANDPELPEGYEYLVKIIKPYEKQEYSQYNLYAARMIQEGETKIENEIFLLLLEFLKPKPKDFLAFKEIEKRHVTLRYKMIEEVQEEKQYRFMIESSPWEHPLPDDFPEKPDYTTVRCIAYRGEPLKVSNIDDD